MKTKLTGVLMFIMVVLILLNVLVLREMSRMESRVDALEKKVTPAHP